MDRTFALRFIALELAASFGEPAKQIARVEFELSRTPSSPDATLVLLPETSFTGYVSAEGDFDLTRFAEAKDGPTSRTLARLAQTYGVYLIGPLIERISDRVYNTMIGFSPTGERILHYQKRHPWYPETWATAGEEAAKVVVVDGMKLTLAICFDIHFVDATFLRGTDVLLFPSAWVEESDSRETMFSSLARSFRVAIVNANWGHGIPRIAGQGTSMIVDANGTVVGTSIDGRAEAVLRPTSTVMQKT